MTTGCKTCDEVQERTGDKGAMCDYHEIGYLEATAYAAAQDYKNAVDKYIEKLEKEKKDEFSNG